MHPQVQPVEQVRPTRLRLGPGRVELAVVVAYAGVLAVLLLHHEMWRDELQAWLLARDSHGLAELWRNTRYEGHPLLWHVLLMAVTRLWTSPAAMQVLHWCIATGAATLFVFRAPFPIAVRAGLVLGYLPLYEYGAISRGYALSVLGAWLFCAVLRSERSALPAAVAAGIAANASPMGILMAPAMALAILSRRRSRGRRIAVGLVVAAAALAAWQCLPAPDYEHARGWVFGWDGVRLLYVLRGFAAALLPVPSPGLHFWNTSLFFPWPLPGGPGGVAVAVLAVAVVGGAVGAGAWVCRHSPSALLFWVTSAAALVTFAYVKFPGTTRHAGFLWVALVAALWLAADDGRATPRAAGMLLAPALAAGLAGAAIAGWWEIRAPFSGAQCASREIVRRGVAELPLVGGNDWATSGVAAFLGTRLYYPSRGGPGSFVIWDLARARQDTMSDGELMAAALRQDRGHGVVLLLNRPLSAGQAGGQCMQLFACTPTIVPDESLWGYLCGTAPASGGGR